RLHCWRPRRNPAPAGAAGRPGPARLRHAAVHRHTAGLHSHPDRRRDQRAAGGADRPAIAVGSAPAVAAAVHRHAWPATALAGPFRPPGIAMAGTTGAPGAPAPARGPALPGVAPVHRPAAGVARAAAGAADPADQLPVRRDPAAVL